MIAIIPAAGRGTRMGPVTGGSPKELLALGSKPVLLRVLEEARGADPDRIVIIGSPEKPEVDTAVREWSASTFADIPIEIIHQHHLNGLAGAVALARADDDAVILVGDCVYAEGSPVERMSNLVYRGLDGCIAVEQVTDAEVSRYGIVEVDEGIGAVRRILEKPRAEETSSRWAVAGRFAFAKPVMGFIGEFVAAHPGSGEVSLSDALAAGIAQGIDIRAVPLQEDQSRLDCGSPEEYERATRRRWD